MKISKFAKSVAYLAAGGILLAVSLWFQFSLHGEDGLEAHYFQSDAYLFILAAAFMGVGAYSYMSYTRRMKEHRGDSLFLFVTGLVLMVLAVVAIVMYGGLEGSFDESGYTAANVNIVILTLTPLPCLVRGALLSLGAGREHPAGRLVVLIVTSVILLAMLVLAFSGNLMQMTQYVESSQESSFIYQL